MVDALKAIASQLIVWHHLAYYGPMSDVAKLLAPGLISWLYSDGRYAVQVFIVLGGFLAARAMVAELTAAEMPALLWRRFLRLAAPIPVILLIAISANELAGQWMTHDSLSPPPEADQLIAHVLLAHKLIGHDSLSAGLWYPGIDFQLFALFMLLALLAARWRWPLIWMVVVLAAASSLFFNRWPAADIYGPYFFGAYGLGIVVALSKGRVDLPVMALFALSALALMMDFRERLLLAMATAALLWLALRQPALMGLGKSRWLGWLADISYSVFLIHFPVLLVVNAGFTHIAAENPLIQAIGMVLGWLLSVAAGAAFHRYVEQPLQRKISRR